MPSPPAGDDLLGMGVERPAGAGDQGEAVIGGQIAARRQMLQTGPGDHRPVVGAQPDRRRHQMQAAPGGDIGQPGAQRSVGGDAAGHDQCMAAAMAGHECLGRTADPVGDAVGDGSLKARRQIGDVLPAQHPDPLRLVTDRGLEAREREVAIRPADHRDCPNRQ